MANPRIWAARHGDIALVGLGFVVAICHATAWSVLLGHSAPPFITQNFDQVKYLTSAHALARGDLTASQHWYPLLYPALLALFVWAGPFYMALIVDLGCYMVTYAGFRAVAARFGLTRLAAVGLFLPSTIAYFIIGAGWLQPWTTTLSAALIWTALALAGSNAAPARRPLALGAVLGAIVLCRPADVMISGMIGLWLIGAMLVGQRQSRRFAPVLARVLAGAGLVGAGGLALHLAIYGPHLTRYLTMSAAYGAPLGRLGWKAYILLIEPLPWYPYGLGLLKVVPWVILGAAGVVVNLARGPWRAQTLLLALPALAFLAMTLAYMELLPSGLWKYSNYHYFKWLLPMLALFAYRFIVDFTQRRTASIASLAAVLLPASLHIMPVPARPDQPARMVTFAAVNAPFEDVYYAQSLIETRAGAMRNGFDYRQVPEDNGPVMAEALRQDFAGDESWVHPGSAVVWPGAMPQGRAIPPLPGRFPQAPLARYTTAVTLGWPCWLPPYGCPAHL